MGVGRHDNFRSEPPFGDDRPDILLVILVLLVVPDSGCPIGDALEPGDLDRLGTSEVNAFPSWVSGEGCDKNALLTPRSSDPS